ncbi:uncharacterized protein J3D65DRAFT_665730 [Phyllosticta citribraziliensis]|uniref:Uncharacterized protein n=1 Tax=Phyllosticta citribraziliensis TaxID=989973 RepID=A0ABR1M0N0_9PEZI
MPPADRSPFMEIPRELHEEIHAYLVVAERTKQPPLHLLPHCPMQNQWNLATSILRVNKQVHEEALGVLGRQNKFVVVERATQKLKSTPEDRKDGECPSCPIWIEKNKKADSKDIDYFILLVEELETLCINLSRYVTGGVYRTNGLVCEVNIAPPPEAETKTVIHRREDSLLNPLVRLRAFAKVNIQGASPEKTMNTVMQMKRKEQTALEAVKTGEQIAETAEAYNRVGYHFMSNSYLDWGIILMGFYENDLLQGEMARQESRKPLHVRFLLQKALNHLRLGDYERAMETGNNAVQFCREVGGMPEWRDIPGVDQSQTRGVVKRGDFMKWATKTTLDRLAAPINRNAITPVDAARAFWYRAIAMVMLQGNSIMEETDRMFAISLLDNVDKQDVANELVALAEDLEDEDPEIVEDDDREINGPISYPSRHARRFADGSFAPTDIPGYNIRTWERPYPPVPQPRHQVTDGGMQFLFSRINPMKGAPERFPGTRYTEM